MSRSSTFSSGITMKTFIILFAGLIGQCVSGASYAEAVGPLSPVHAQALSSMPQVAEPPMNKALASDGPCSIKTLRGTYAFNFEGTIDSGATSVRQSGIETFDGKGNVLSKVTTKRGSLATQSMETYLMIYTINSDCSGKLSDANGPYADIFVDPNGGSFRYIFINPSHLISGETKRTSLRILSLGQ